MMIYIFLTFEITFEKIIKVNRTACKKFHYFLLILNISNSLDLARKTENVHGQISEHIYVKWRLLCLLSFKYLSQTVTRKLGYITSSS